MNGIDPAYLWFAFWWCVVAFVVAVAWGFYSGDLQQMFAPDPVCIIKRKEFATLRTLPRNLPPIEVCRKCKHQYRGVRCGMCGTWVRWWSNETKSKTEVAQ